MFQFLIGKIKNLVAKAKEATFQKQKEAEAKKESEEREIAEKFERAKQTGQKVEIRRWTDGCCDPREECDLDIVIEYAMPDGTTKTERHHTW